MEIEHAIVGRWRIWNQSRKGVLFESHLSIVERKYYVGILKPRSVQDMFVYSADYKHHSNSRSDDRGCFGSLHSFSAMRHTGIFASLSQNQPTLVYLLV